MTGFTLESTQLSVSNFYVEFLIDFPRQGWQFLKEKYTTRRLQDLQGEGKPWEVSKRDNSFDPEILGEGWFRCPFSRQSKILTIYAGTLWGTKEEGLLANQARLTWFITIVPQRTTQLSTRGRAVRKRASLLSLTLRIITFEEGDFPVPFQPARVCLYSFGNIGS